MAKVERLALRIDADLKQWAKEYAAERKTDVTTLVTAYLVSLKQRELEAARVEAEQA